MAMQRTANDVDQIKRSSSPNLTGVDRRALRILQGNNCERAFTNGSLHQTHQRTKTSHVVLITRKQQSGFSKAEYTKNGSQQVRFSGSTENVRSVPFPSRYALMASCNVAGSGKGVLWFVNS
jgi:hypothetical protein